MKLQLLRHATLLMHFAGRRILVDPMLSPAGSLDPVANSADQRRIPLVRLPISAEGLMSMLLTLDAVLLTHTHRDHWDDAARVLLPEDMPIVCQPHDRAALEAAGFETIRPLEQSLNWQGIEIIRTEGRHGTGELGQRMGPVSGFVLRSANEPVLYIAGDTVWCPEVESALRTYQPDLIVLNTGAAQFLTGDPITMDVHDVAAVCRAAPNAQVVAAHMEAVNHCSLLRSGLRAGLIAEGLLERVLIPEDGEEIIWEKG